MQNRSSRNRCSSRRDEFPSKLESSDLHYKSFAFLLVLLPNVGLASGKAADRAARYFRARSYELKIGSWMSLEMRAVPETH